MKFITLEMVINLHDMIIMRKGGLSGIRDVGLLMSAIETPKAMMYGEFLHPSIYDKASAYLYHIACNHPFLDGNKRTAVSTALVFLDLNEVTVDVDQSQFEELVVEVAKGVVRKHDISAFIQCKPRATCGN